MPLSPLRTGDPAEIGGFRLVARLGAGGMGVVYVGTDQAGRPAAVKAVKAEFAADPAFRTRFRREVAAARAVAGTCTARVLDADPDAEEPWLATEYVGGASLYDVVSADGAFGDDLLHPLAVGLAEALVAIHEAGVVHRDLKPANVLLAPDGPKVIDFGIAALEEATLSSRTGVGMGSPGYMAPEQVTGASVVGPPVDVYAWGLTVVYAATGHPPFGTGPAQALMYRAVEADVDLTGLPAWIEPLVRAALQREPQNRPTARQLHNELLRGGRPEGNDHPTAPLPADATQIVLHQEWHQPSAARSPQLPSQPLLSNSQGSVPQTRPAPKSRTPLVLASLVAFAVAGALAWVLFLAPDRKDETSADSSPAPAPTATVESTPETPTETAVAPPETSAPETTTAGTTLDPDMPHFYWDLGDEQMDAAFRGFTKGLEGQVVRIDSFIDSTPQIDKYFVPEPGEDSEYDDPHFTLFDCDGLADGQEPGFPPEAPCEATTYLLDLDGEDEGDARFLYFNNTYSLSGYFEVEYEGTEDGVNTVTLKGLNENDVEE